MFRGKKGFFLSFLLAGALCLFVMWSVFGRSVCVEVLKKELVKIQTSLNDAGYDLAYEDLQFSPSFLHILKIRDLKVYSLDPDNYAEWHVPEFKVNAGLFNPHSLTIKMSYNQYIQKSNKTFITDFPNLKVVLDVDENIGLKNITVVGKKLSVEGLLSIDEFKLASQRMAPQKISEFTPFFENHLEARGVHFSDDLQLPIKKEISRLYINANVIGVIKPQESYKQSILSWVLNGGIVDVKKVVLNSDTLNMVGRGDLYFNEGLEPNLHITASSKGLIEFIDDFQDAGLLDNKGVFVVKIILNSKAVLLNENDNYKTVTAPINVNSKEISVENIPIFKFN